MKLKSAFTLAEIMIFLVIVGIIMSILLVTFKPQKIVTDKSVKYKYAAVYDALNLATYDLVYDKDETNPFVVVDNNPVNGFQKLCSGLSGYINTESENCSAPIPKAVAFMQDENFDFRTLQPHLTALNGMKIYLSELITDNVTPKTNRSYYNPENPDFTLQFYMVYVDLNGSENQKKPHSIFYDTTGKTNPDVFAFAIIPTGEAIPMGLAEYDIKYFATRVSYKENKYIYFSPYYSYRQAKHAAWDWYKNGSSNIQFKEKISFTYNDYIKEILRRNSSELYKFNNTNAFPETFSNSMFSKCIPTAGTALTVYDMCGITVDTPHFGATH